MGRRGGWSAGRATRLRSLRRASTVGAMCSRIALFLACLLTASNAVAQQPNVRVGAEGRIDWVFAVANQSPAEPPADWLKGYNSKAQTYELYVPARGKPASWGLVLFISPTERGAGLE